MDDDGLNMRNWGYYEPYIKRNLGMQFMSSMVDREPKPFIFSRDEAMAAANGMFHTQNYLVSRPPDAMDVVRDNRINHIDKLVYMFPENAYCNILAYTSGSHQMRMIQQPELIKDVRVKVEDTDFRKKTKSGKKRDAVTVPKTPKSKKSKKSSSIPKENGNSFCQRSKAAKKSMDAVINGIDLDISDIPIQFVHVLVLLNNAIDGDVVVGSQHVALQLYPCTPCL